MSVGSLIMQGVDRFMDFLTATILAIFLALICVVVGILISPWWAYETIRINLFIRRMRKKGRYVDWDDLVPKLEAGEGTVLVSSRSEIWWTNEIVLSLAPTPYPTDNDGDWSEHPFMIWCRKEYLDPKVGRAFLTGVPYKGFCFADTFIRHFPKTAALDIAEK